MHNKFCLVIPPEIPILDSGPRPVLQISGNLKNIQ